MGVALDGQGRKRVTVVPGDGIGPEVVAAARRVLDAAGVSLAWEECEAGAAVFARGLATGVPEATLDSLRATRVALKGPLATPVGAGEKSANVTLRKLFETYANVRHVRELPGVRTPFSGRGIDLVVVRENVEDLYAGIEHQQTPGVAQCLKLVSKEGSARVIRHAFELAVAERRRRVDCVTKANIMKLTEGLFLRTFQEIAKEYPGLETGHLLVDNCAHQLVTAPEKLDVLVMTNMNGDILSDLASGLVGGLGVAPGANVGDDVAIFEAVHGTAPDIAGKGIANPTAVLLSTCAMLRHLDEPAAAARIEEALAAALADGVHTKDLGAANAVTTSRFADAVIARLGKRPEGFRARDVSAIRKPAARPVPPPAAPPVRVAVGVDIFVESVEGPDVVGTTLESLAEGTPLKLKMVSNRGTRVYPATGALTACVDHYRARFIARDSDAPVTDADVLRLLGRIGARLRWMHVEKLETHDGVPAYTRAQGEA